MMSSSGADLGTFFSPASIAVVGVSRKVGAFGGALFLRRYREAGFKGALYPIHPEAGELDGLRAYPSLSSLPEVPELVIVAVKADLVLSVLEECARIGVRHIHIFASGFSEIGTREGADLDDASRRSPAEGSCSDRPQLPGPTALRPASPRGVRCRASPAGRPDLAERRASRSA
jgi:acyl-CoA synthetase (NDP forming)